MVATAIGSSSEIVRIGDHATPGSGTYELYIPAKFRFNWPDDWIENTNIQGQGGNNVAEHGFILDMEYVFEMVPIQTWATYEALRKALFYWSKNDSLLYLSIKPQGFATNSIAVGATFAAPTTLTTFSGKIRDYTEQNWHSNGCDIGFKFPYVTG